MTAKLVWDFSERRRYTRRMKAQKNDSPCRRTKTVDRRGEISRAAIAFTAAKTEQVKESILEEANRLVHGPRGADYSHPASDYSCTGEMWRSMIVRRYGIDVPFTPDFCCLMMIAMKLSREAGKAKRDNLVDAAGYAECAGMCLEVAQKPETTAHVGGVVERILKSEPDDGRIPLKDWPSSLEHNYMS